MRHRQDGARALGGKAPQAPASKPEVVPVVEEEPVVTKRQRRTGSVKVQKRVRQETRRIAVPLVRESVDVKRVPIGREVTGVPPVRSDGDRIVVPVIEEELVVAKRLILKEEIHLIRRRAEHVSEQDVVLRGEEVEIQRRQASRRRRRQ